MTTMAHFHRVFDSLMRVAAVFLLAGFALPDESVVSNVFFVLALVIIVLDCVVFFVKRSDISSLWKSPGDYVFYPGVLLIWTAISYSKGINITAHLILLAISIVLEIAVAIIERKTRSVND